MKKKWYEIIDYYRLTGIVLLWTASWIFMIPWKTEIISPFYNNIWGALFAVFGAAAQKSVEVQQTPDLASGLFALVLIIVLQLRGIFNITHTVTLSEEDSKRHKFIIVATNLLSIIVHTLFFTMLIKIFLFPDKGSSALTARLTQNITITLFSTICITGMILGAQNIARLIVIIFSIAALFFNINFVSSTMGVWGFIAILLAAAGFYLEFCFNGFSKEHLLIDLAFIAGKYDRLELKSKDESKNIVRKIACQSLKLF